VSGLEAGAVWQFSTDGGASWSSDILVVAAKTATAIGPVQLQFRQVDRAGNISEVSAINFTFDNFRLHQLFNWPTIQACRVMGLRVIHLSNWALLSLVPIFCTAQMVV